MLRIAISAVAALALLGCSSVAVTDRDEYKGPKLPRPGRILVFDFAATPEDLPVWSQERTIFVQRMAEAAAEEQQELDEEQREKKEKARAEQSELGRKLGASVAKQLVAAIAEMGLPAVRAEGEPEPNPDDIVLIGAFTSMEQGSLAKRLVIGFGSGNDEVRTHVAGYRMTPSGLVRLGSGTLDTSGGKSPGLAIPVLVTIATANPIGLVVGGAVKATNELDGSTSFEGAAGRTAQKIAEELEKKFEEQGWI